MPNRKTFSIKPIRNLLEEEITPGLWVDPFSGGSMLAHVTNDLNPDIDADYHLDALEFLGRFQTGEIDGGILYDPPYSVRQVSECYRNFGYEVTQETTRSDWYTRIKTEIAWITAIGAKVISFGWSSNGIGKTNGFRIDRILLVPHGGIHNDTICVVETKVREVQFEKERSDLYL